MKKVIRRGTVAALAVLLSLTPGCVAPASPTAAASANVTPAPTATSAPAGDPNRYYTVNEGSLQGIINGLGQTVLPIQYGGAYVMEWNDAPAFFLAEPAKPISGAPPDDETLLFNLDGTRLTDKVCRQAEPLSGGLIAYLNLEFNYGVMAYDGTEIVPCQYSSVMMCGESIIAVSSGAEDSGIDVYDKQGTRQCSGSLNLFEVAGELLVVTDASGQNFGLMNTQLEEIVPAYCSTIIDAGSGLYVIGLCGKYGVVNSQGEEVVPPAFDAIEPYTPGTGDTPYFSASAPEGAYVFDGSGKQLLFLKGYVSAALDGDILIAKDTLGLSHYLKDGKDVIPPGPSITWDAEAQIIISSSYGACACYTKDGNKLPLPVSYSIGAISPDRFIFCERSSYNYGICDADGTVIVPADYSSLFSFGEEGLVIFSKTEAGVRTQGVINSLSGKILLGGYDTLWMAGGGLFSVQIGSTHGLVDLSGSWIWKSDKLGTY